MRMLFKDLMKEKKYAYDYNWDWKIEENIVY